ncbi:MAG TPA: FAD-binding oxidoreductase, partial [Planctomycetota bacterium]|nr:FAD-binding oxidoreductase [Planctomycetota bacterium]
IGGGVMGARIAWACARRTHGSRGSVALFERRALAAGSSGRSGAVLRQHYSSPHVAAMARDSLVEYATLEQRTGKGIGFQRCGVLTIAGPRTPEMMERVRVNVAMQRGIGIDTQVVDAREMRRLAPGIEVDERAIAAWEPGGGFCDPVRAVHAFAELAVESGASLQIGLEVRRVIVEGGRAVGIETNGGRVDAEAVVLAAGPWTRPLLVALGSDMPLEVVRPRQHFLASPSETVSATAAHPVLLDLELGYYTRCEPSRSRTRIGALEHQGDAKIADPDELDEDVDVEFTRWARGKLEQRMPVYRARADQAPQAAWYTLTPDSQPILGRVAGIENLFIAAGFSGHGFKLAPSVGEGIAQLVFGEPLRAFDADFFSADRFQGGQGGDASAFGL